MALFTGNKKDKIVDSTTSATIITSCMEVTGNLDGSDTVHIDGLVTGNITVSNTVVIGKSGVVKGVVRAKNAIINGELEGSIFCETLEVMQTGRLSNNIEATTLILDGTVNGTVIGLERIDILRNGVLEVAKIQSKNITVNGSVKGKIIASELLDIGSTGSVEGEISVKNIKTAEGGRMIGTMASYEAPKTKSEEPKVEKRQEDKLESQEV